MKRKGIMANRDRLKTTTDRGRSGSSMGMIAGGLLLIALAAILIYNWNRPSAPAITTGSPPNSPAQPSNSTR
jgi:hypothetical protein